VSTVLYYASDIHGSDVLWRKFINAGKYYDAQVLVMGGDITGKAVVPVVDTGSGYRVQEVTGGQLLDEDALPAVEKRVRDMGFYPYRLREDELEAIYADEAAVDEVFAKVMRDSLAAWLQLAEMRLAGTGTRLYVMIGNDDDVTLREVIAASEVAVDPEDQVVEIGEGFTMYSCGWTNRTPWNTPREMPEDEFEVHLEEHLVGLERPERAVFNFHCPPYGTGLDRAPLLDDTLKPVVRAGAVEITSVGSTAVRHVIERHQPALGLHGHIHESRGVAKVGKTLCINTGSEYAEGVLHGALITLDAKKGVRHHTLASG
jgi:uncharacterized protein